MIQESAFKDLLVSKGILTEQDFIKLKIKFKDDGLSVLEHLFRTGAAEKSVLGMLWSEAIGVAYVDLDKTLFQSQLVAKLPKDFAVKNHIIPLYQLGEKVTVAAANPANLDVINEAEWLMEVPVSPVFSFLGDIADAIKIQYQTSHSLEKSVTGMGSRDLFKEHAEFTSEQLENLASDNNIVEFAQNLMLLGVKERASDIHIDPHEEMIAVRFRIDGVLHDKIELEKGVLLPLSSRLKILAELDITEIRRPQDGRINIQLSNKSIDIRLSSIPTIHGEKIVLRILGQIDKQTVPGLNELSFSKSTLLGLHRVMKVPFGCFFVTGPTGSGKTTTLFSLLKHINEPEVNIMTVEDPVEFRLPGINQIQVNNAVSLDFAVSLRSFLRQDPDVILIGEIRDTETARIAVRAALTGHFVLASMHTNNASQALTRLIDIGVEPFLVAPSMIGVMSQRLVRTICVHCKEKYPLTTAEMERFFVWEGKQQVFFCQGKGCAECNYTGYMGRLAIHEVLMVNEEIRSLITKGGRSSEVQRAAGKIGFQTMRYDGLKKVLRGMTTLAELERVVVAEEEF